MPHKSLLAIAISAAFGFGVGIQAALASNGLLAVPKAATKQHAVADSSQAAAEKSAASDEARRNAAHRAALHHADAARDRDIAADARQMQSLRADIAHDRAQRRTDVNELRAAAQRHDRAAMLEERQELRRDNADLRHDRSMLNRTRADLHRDLRDEERGERHASLRERRDFDVRRDREGFERDQLRHTELRDNDRNTARAHTVTQVDRNRIEAQERERMHERFSRAGDDRDLRADRVAEERAERQREAGEHRGFERHRFDERARADMRDENRGMRFEQAMQAREMSGRHVAFDEARRDDAAPLRARIPDARSAIPQLRRDEVRTYAEMSASHAPAGD